MTQSRGGRGWRCCPGPPLTAPRSRPVLGPQASGMKGWCGMHVSPGPRHASQGGHRPPRTVPESGAAPSAAAGRQRGTRLPGVQTLPA